MAVSGLICLDNAIRPDIPTLIAKAEIFNLWQSSQDFRPRREGFALLSTTITSCCIPGEQSDTNPRIAVLPQVIGVCVDINHNQFAHVQGRHGPMNHHADATGCWITAIYSSHFPIVLKNASALCCGGVYHFVLET
jgi:hypothetical protein